MDKRLKGRGRGRGRGTPLDLSDVAGSLPRAVSFFFANIL